MRKLLFILLAFTFLSCKKEVPEPDFNIVGQWETMGLLAYQFNSNGTLGQSTTAFWSLAKLQHPYYQLTTRQGTKIEKEAIRVITSDRFEIVGIARFYDRRK
jgi:hypothetical protein